MILVGCTEGEVVPGVGERLESAEPCPASVTALFSADMVVVFDVVVEFLCEVECTPIGVDTCIDGVSETDGWVRRLEEVETVDIMELVVVTARVVDDELVIARRLVEVETVGVIELVVVTARVVEDEVVVVTGRVVEDELVVALESVSSEIGTIEFGLGIGTIELGSDTVVSLARLYWNQR